MELPELDPPQTEYDVVEHWCLTPLDNPSWKGFPGQMGSVAPGLVITITKKASDIQALAYLTSCCVRLRMLCCLFSRKQKQFCAQQATDFSFFFCWSPPRPSPAKGNKWVVQPVGFNWAPSL